MNDFDRVSATDRGRAVRIAIVVTAMVIPVVAVLFAIRSEQPTSGQTAATTAPESGPAPTSATSAAPTETSAPAATTIAEAPASSSAETSDDTAPSGPETTTSDSAATLNTSAVVARTTPLANQPGANGGDALEPGQQVAFTGDIEVVDDHTWFGVDTGSAVGWVAASDLALATTSFDRRPCAELPDGVAPNPLAYRPGTTDGDATGVVAIETHTAADCRRVVMVLGSLADGALADAFPADLDVIDFGGLVRVDLPGAVHAPELTLLEIEDNGVVLSATREGGETSLFVDSGAASVHVSFLANPARIVVDSLSLDDARPALSDGGVILASSTFADARDAGDGSVVLVKGWARLPGGLGQIAFRNAPDEGRPPESGLAYDAVFSGTSSVGTVQRSWYFYRTATSGDQWSEFSFEISGLVAGDYEMFLGLGGVEPPADIDVPGIITILNVADPS